MLTALFVMFIIRQFYQKNNLKKRARTQIFFGGWLSVVVWNICYISILAAAIVKIREDQLSPTTYWGFLIFCGGIYLRALSFRALRSFYDVFMVIKVDHQVVQSGPYKYLRHPLHLGLMIEMLGLAIISKAVVVIPLMFLSLILLVQRNVKEEQTLMSLPEYGPYRSKAWDVTDILKGFGK